MPDTPSRTLDSGSLQQNKQSEVDDTIWWLDHHVMITMPMIEKNNKWGNPKKEE